MEKKNILIAEDEIIISLDIKTTLQKNNFKVVSISTTGEDLINQYRLKHPDLIIADFNLKGKISGIDAIREVRKINSTPIILISGSTESKLKKFCSTVPLCEFLVKPFEDTRLLEIIYKFLPSDKLN